MATVYGFKNKDTAQRLERMAGGSQPKSSPQGISLIKGQGWILKTPPEGIPGRTGDVVEVADCVVYMLDLDPGTATLQPRQIDNADVEQAVYNIWSADVAGDTYITAKVVDGKLIVDAEDCG